MYTQKKSPPAKRWEPETSVSASNTLLNPNWCSEWPLIVTRQILWSCKRCFRTVKLFMDLHQAKRTSQEVTETTETTESTESTESTEIGSTQQSDSQLSLKVKLKSISTHTQYEDKLKELWLNCSHRHIRMADTIKYHNIYNHTVTCLIVRMSIGTFLIDNHQQCGYNDDDSLVRKENDITSLYYGL